MVLRYTLYSYNLVLHVERGETAMFYKHLIMFFALAHTAMACSGGIPAELVGINSEKLKEIDHAVNEAIAAKQCPGAVVLVSRFKQVIWHRAYGNRMVEPWLEPMTCDTIFDIASMTKAVVTAPAIMHLIEQKKVMLHDRIADYFSLFAYNGKESITVEQLLRHRSGLTGNNPISDYEHGYSIALERISLRSLGGKPDTEFCYSDSGYIILGELFNRVSGESLDAFAVRQIFAPLGMHDTLFNPPSSLHERIAPNTQRNGSYIRGIVHDNAAYLSNQVMGHTGVFSTASDLAIFAHMMLARGMHNGIRVLPSSTIDGMTSAGNTPLNHMRGLGWDMDTHFSYIRGSFPIGGYGHTGFTGTSLWIDPASQIVVIILTNRLHPDGQGDVVPLRKKIATIVAEAII